MTESVRKSLPLQDGVNSLFCHELVIGGFIHKAVQFGRISQAQAKKPAVLLRIAVDERRLIFKRAVHFNDFAGNRRIDIRSGFPGFDDSRIIAFFEHTTLRSEERRVGKDVGNPFRSRWKAYHFKKNEIETM